jgi:hypothetical protein
LKEVTLEKDRLAGLEVSTVNQYGVSIDSQDELDAMKTSARMRSVSQSVQPEDPVSPKRQRTGSVKPKEKARKAPSVIEEVESDAEEPVVEKPKKKVQEKTKRATSVIQDVGSDIEEPVVEQPKKNVAAKPAAAEKKAKENRPMMPRVTVRKVGLAFLTTG